MIEDLHFLRPLWLLGLPVIALAWWLIRRRDAKASPVATFVAPHLRDALTINRRVTSRLFAVDGVALALLALTVAAAGPSVGKQQAPWFEETAALVIAIEISDSMLATDVRPSRLERAKFKTLDLLERRTGARTALIAYAGTAHIVLPPTTDVAVFRLFLEGLDPAVMPEPGSNAALVLPPAARLLAGDEQRGTVLFVNDGFSEADLPALATFASDPAAPSLAALVVGSDAGGVALTPDGFPITDAAGAPIETTIDSSLLRQAERDANLAVVRMATGDSDLRAVLRAVESSLSRADDPDAEWQDRGWWLLWPAALLMLAWFRRGWTMRW